MQVKETVTLLKQARDHYFNTGDGRASCIMDLAASVLENQPVQWRHLDAVESAARECQQPISEELF